ncbi:hypothetical protein CLOM_g15721 [Closterium sp. NIES-68]|nr:hypothetical protein CLOM_g15721 [Closterium sp. NIES-68]
MLEYNVRADWIANYSTGTIIMLVNNQDRPLVENISGYPIRSVLGLASPEKDYYAVNVVGSVNPDFPLQPFTDFFPLVPPNLADSILAGKSTASPPVSVGPGYVASVFVIPIFRQALPANATVQQMRESFSTVWAGVIHLQGRARDILNMLGNGSTAYSFAMYDTTEPGKLIQVFGPDQPVLEKGSAFPFVLPVPIVAPPEHVEPFPEDLFGQTYEAHCR